MLKYQHEICFPDGRVICFNEGDKFAEWEDTSRYYKGIHRFLMPACAAFTTINLGLAVASVVTLEDLLQNLIFTGTFAIAGILGKVSYSGGRKQYNPYFNSSMYDPAYLMPKNDCQNAPFDKEGFVIPPNILARPNLN